MFISIMHLVTFFTIITLSEKWKLLEFLEVHDVETVHNHFVSDELLFITLFITTLESVNSNFPVA